MRGTSFNQRTSSIPDAAALLPPPGYNSVVYNKGGYIIHMLRMMLQNPRNPGGPDAHFEALMKDFCQTYGSGAASTEDFKAVVEKHLTPMMDLDKNGRMDWFFNQYVYGAGRHPRRCAFHASSGVAPMAAAIAAARRSHSPMASRRRRRPAGVRR